MAQVRPRYVTPIAPTDEVVDADTPTPTTKSVLYENRVAIMVIVLLVIIIFVAAYFIFKTTADIPAPAKVEQRTNGNSAPTPQQVAREKLEIERLINDINTTPPLEPTPTMPKQPTPRQHDVDVQNNNDTTEHDAPEHEPIEESPTDTLEQPDKTAPPAELITQPRSTICGYELTNGSTCKVKSKSGGYCSKHR